MTRTACSINIIWWSSNFEPVRNSVCYQAFIASKNRYSSNLLIHNYDGVYMKNIFSSYLIMSVYTYRQEWNFGLYVYKNHTHAKRARMWTAEERVSPNCAHSRSDTAAFPDRTQTRLDIVSIRHSPVGLYFSNACVIVITLTSLYYA